MTRAIPTSICVALALWASVNSAGADTGEADTAFTIPFGHSAPNIDGVVNEAEWADAHAITDFHQFEPTDHGAASEKSQFWIKYNEDFLFVAARLTDSEPDKIVARQLVQGQSLAFDDAIEIILDPFLNGRSGYNFQVNPNGIRREALYEDTTELNRDWKTIWYTNARITENGWEAEIAIPFKSINFNPTQSEWGLTLARTIARKQEEIAWRSFGRTVNPSTAGSMQGLNKARQGLGLDMVPTVSVTSIDDRPGTDSGVELEPSLDVFYKFTPSLTGVLTFNTDFAATEVDARQVNLTRFDLFFPEKRDFFLQDADIFVFGGLQQENGQPFFSRRIGLSDKGEPLDLNFGGKVTGRIGNASIGLLAVQQEDSYDDNDTEVMVGKVSYNLSPGASIGAIFTDGDPLSELSNSLYGFDFQYRSKTLVENTDSVLDLWYQRSDTESFKGDDLSWGAKVSIPRLDGWAGEFAFKRIEENFNPALGFVNRTDIEETALDVDYTWRFEDSWLRGLKPGVDYKEVKDTDGELEGREVMFRPVLLQTDSGDQLKMTYLDQREVVNEAFELIPDLYIQPDDYRFDRYQVEVETAQTRKFAVNGEIIWGDFYGGDLVTIKTGVDWRPSRHLYLGLSYEVNEGDLPEGNFTTRLLALNADIAFNSRWSWTNFIQYDNVSDSANLYSRLRWNPQPGQDLYFVINQGFKDDDERGFISTDTEVTLKVSYLFRF